MQDLALTITFTAFVRYFIATKPILIVPNEIVCMYSNCICTCDRFPFPFCNLSLQDVPVFRNGFTINCVWQI